MTTHEKDADFPVVRDIDADEVHRCESCGTERRPGDPVLCVVCGQPVAG